ncbi:MAG: hypothetical protein ACW97X_07510 [Candidatus Hodarchaeales archaeon]
MTESIQCPCGHDIKDYNDYLLLFLKKDMGEIDILCPNDYCYLRELGFLKFDIGESGDVIFEKGRFYAPYVTWNATKMTEEATVRILRQHLIDIAEKNIDWERIKKDHISDKQTSSLQESS